MALTKSKIKPFLQYQCEQLNEPILWLNKLEKLIDLNRELFTTKEQNIKIEKALIVIELLRDTLQHKSICGGYDFTKVKAELKKYTNDEERLVYLVEMKTAYLQNKPVYVNVNEVSFDEKINLEIDLIKAKETGAKARSQTRG